MAQIQPDVLVGAEVRGVQKPKLVSRQHFDEFIEKYADEKRVTCSGASCKVASDANC